MILGGAARPVAASAAASAVCSCLDTAGVELTVSHVLSITLLLMYTIMTASCRYSFCQPVHVESTIIA